ncbi:MAG: anti-sigma factor [Microbacterium sp.]|uniref:anti-sigma factor n=1 Tax=Microbacterium sp. TaxID=51671 RepID=UPI0039E23267
MTESEFAVLAAGRALHALSPEDDRALAAALASHPEWERHLRDAADAAALLADRVPEVTPPTPLRDAVLARIAQTPPRPSHVARRRWLALAASVGLIVVLALSATVAGILAVRPENQAAWERIQRAPDARTATVVLADGGTATASWSASLGEAALETEGLPALASDQTFEMWLVRDGEAIPAGTFLTDAAGVAETQFQAVFQQGDVMAVTVEPAGGSPTGAPTSAPFISIPS